MGIAVLCILDKRGKEVYFAEDPTGTEYSFQVGVGLKLSIYQTWTIKTDDWGYFYRAFFSTWNNSNSSWKSYDAFLAIVLTAGVTGILFFILSIMDIRKFSNFNWSVATCVRVIVYSFLEHCLLHYCLHPFPRW